MRNSNSALSKLFLAKRFSLPVRRYSNEPILLEEWLSKYYKPKAKSWKKELAEKNLSTKDEIALLSGEKWNQLPEELRNALSRFRPLKEYLKIMYPQNPKESDWEKELDAIPLMYGDQVGALSEDDWKNLSISPALRAALTEFRPSTTPAAQSLPVRDAEMERVWQYLLHENCEPKTLPVWEKQGENYIKTEKPSGVEIVSLPEGYRWPTEALNDKTDQEALRHLFIRACDKDLWNIAMKTDQSNGGGLLIVGNPGIGIYVFINDSSSCRKKLVSFLLFATFCKNDEGKSKYETYSI